MKKYSNEFLRDVRWYLSMRHKFNFDGNLNYLRKFIEVTKVRNEGRKVVSVEQISSKDWERNYGGFIGDKSIGFYYSYFFKAKAEPMIVYDKKGVDGIEAFFNIDSRGVILSTRHPNLLKTLLKTKGSTNLHIKMYAEDRASFLMGGLEFRALCISFKAPDWFRQAVENQKIQIWNKQ